MTQKNFDKCMAIFFATFRGIKITDENLEIWKELLKDLSDQDFEVAVIKICREVKDFYPTTNFVALVRDQLKENQQDVITLAWEQVLKSFKHAGESVKFADPVIHSCLEMMGGWQKIFNWEEKEMKWIRKEFFDLYPTMMKKGDHLEYLPGKHEINNNWRGFHKEIKPPILIGFEKEKEKLITA